MTVFEAYRLSWAQRQFVIPLFIAIRLLSVFVIVPLTALLIPLALSLSGQAALTDQDIAYFFVSPLGFPVFLGIGAILLLGSVIGVAAMTLKVRQGPSGSMSQMRATLSLLGARLPAIMLYAVHLIMRILLIIAPFAVVSLFIVSRLIGAYDINFYLSTRPPEFLWTVGLVGSLLLVMAVILLNRLLLWAVSLHLVIFDGVAPSASFKLSGERMLGRRVALVKSLLGWFLLRAVLGLSVAFVFGWLMSLVVASMGEGFRAKLTLSLIIGAVWSFVGLIIGAIALGALARLLNAYHDGAATIPVEVPTGSGPTITMNQTGFIGEV